MNAGRGDSQLVLTTLTRGLQFAIALLVCPSVCAVIEHTATSSIRYVGTTILIPRTCTGQIDRALAITRAGITHIGKQAVPININVADNDPSHIHTVVNYALDPVRSSSWTSHQVPHLGQVQDCPLIHPHHPPIDALNTEAADR